MPWHTPLDSCGSNVRRREPDRGLPRDGLAPSCGFAWRSGRFLCRGFGHFLKRLTAVELLFEDWRSRVFDFLAGDPLPVSDTEAWCRVDVGQLQLCHVSGAIPQLKQTR